jgi:serine/threonine protein kinase
MVLLHYRLLEKAGFGAMGEVWKAEDTKLGRAVAVKFVPQRLAGHANALEAFRQEARLAAALNHPNICTIYGLEECGGRWFLVMEYIDGRPASVDLVGEPLAATRVVQVGIQAAEALAAAHSSGVIHRDVKPANLMLTAGGRLKLTDFGIARSVRSYGSCPGGGAHTPTGRWNTYPQSKPWASPWMPSPTSFPLAWFSMKWRRATCPFTATRPQPSSRRY